MQAEGFAAGAAPTAVGLAHVEAAVGREGRAVVATLEAAAEGQARALPFTVHLLQRHAHDEAFALVAHKHLPGEGAELPAGRVHHRLGEGLAHGAVGELDGGELAKLREVLGAAGVALEVRVPLERRRVAVEGVPADVVQGRGAHPLALVVGDEEVAIRGHAEAVRRTESFAPRDELALGRDLETPAEILARTAHANAGDGAPEVALLVAHGAEDVGVLAAGDAAVLVEGLEEVGLAIAVGVGDARQLGALHDEDFSGLAGEQAQRLVQAGGEEFPLVPVAGRADLGSAFIGGRGRAQRVPTSTLEHRRTVQPGLGALGLQRGVHVAPDFPASRADHQRAVALKRHAAHLQRDAAGHGDGLQLVVARLTRGREVSGEPGIELLAQVTAQRVQLEVERRGLGEGEREEVVARAQLDVKGNGISDVANLPGEPAGRAEVGGHRAIVELGLHRPLAADAQRDLAVGVRVEGDEEGLGRGVERGPLGAGELDGLGTGHFSRAVGLEHGRGGQGVDGSEANGGELFQVRGGRGLLGGFAGGLFGVEERGLHHRFDSLAPTRGEGRGEGDARSLQVIEAPQPERLRVRLQRLLRHTVDFPHALREAHVIHQTIAAHAAFHEPPEGQPTRLRRAGERLGRRVVDELAVHEEPHALRLDDGGERVPLAIADVGGGFELTSPARDVEAEHAAVRVAVEFPVLCRRLHVAGNEDVETTFRVELRAEFDRQRQLAVSGLALDEHSASEGFAECSSE